MITYGEVFAGIGAARAAFDPLGWQAQYFIEKKNSALAQYLYNWSLEFRQVVDSQNMEHNDILKLASMWSDNHLYRNLYNVNREILAQGRENFDVDVCMTSPPCKSFSVLGSRGGLDDEGDLFFETHRFLELTKPKVFILENVKGMMSIVEDLRYDNLARKNASHELFKFQPALFPPYIPRRTYHDIILPSLGISCNGTLYPKLRDGILVWRERYKEVVSLKPLPYRIFPRLINATSFGSPMLRERIIIVGFRTDLNIKKFNYQIPVDIPTKKILNLIEPNRRRSDDFRFREFYAGQSYYEKAKNSGKVIDENGLHLLRGGKPFIHTLTTRIDPERATIVRNDQGIYRSFADEQMRRLTGFPEGFHSNVVSQSAVIDNYGNSIYVPMLQHIGRLIENKLKR